MTATTFATTVLTESATDDRPVAAWTPSAAALADLSDRVATDGPDAHAADLRALVSYACDQGVATTLLAVLTDTAAPAVVRLRAYAKVAAAVSVAA